MKSIKIFLASLLILAAGLCDARTQTKTPPKSAPAAGASAPSQDTRPQPKPSDDEAIPAAGPNAIFPAIVARVNGKPVLGRDLEELIRRELASIGSPEWKNLREEYRGELTVTELTVLINSKLLYQKAIASGIKATPEEVQAELQKVAKSYASDAEFNAALASRGIDRATLEKNFYETVAMQKYVDESVNKKIVVTQEELSKYYTSNPTQFSHPEIVKTSHILIRPAGDSPEQDTMAKERAEALLNRIKKGEDFAKLARENSVDASASQGGDVGFASKEGMEPEYAEAAFSLPVGGVKLVKTQYGYHIIKVTEKKKEGLATLDEVKDQLTEYLKNQKIQTELAKLVSELREAAKIEILIPAIQPQNP